MKSVSWLIFSVILFLGLSCTEQPDQPVRIGLNLWPGYEYLHLAKEQGFYDEAGLNIEFVEMHDLSQVRRSYERGQTDGMASTLVEILQVLDRNDAIQPHIILVADFSNGGDVIMARGEIHKIADLEGKRVGVEAGSVSAYLLARALATEGLNLQSVELVWMTQREMYDAMKMEQVDAVVTYPPTSVQLQRENLGKRIFDSSEIPEQIVDVVTVNQSVLDQDPEFKAKFMKAWAMAIQYAEANPEKAYALMARRLQLTPEEVQQELQLVKNVTAEEQVNFRQGERGLNHLMTEVEAVLQDTGQLHYESLSGRVKY